MDQRKAELGLKQPSAARTICVKDLHGDCMCAKCRLFKEAAQVGNPLGHLRDPAKAAKK